MVNYKKILLKNPYSPTYWLVLGLIVKGILFLGVILNHPYRDILGIWGATMGDDSSYLDPIDNLLQYGTYSHDFRMPGYGLFYLLFRLIFAQPGACNALIILQLLLASTSVYYLALTALNIFKNNAIFYIAFYLFIFCSFSNFFDAYIGSESLCTSLLIFSVYFFTKYFNEQKSKYLFIAGLLATWTMFIRPVFGGLVVACSILILCQNGKLKIHIKHAFLFLIPFLICEGSWIYRNFQIHKKFIPFTTTGSFYPNAATSYLQPLFEFVQSWGGVCSFTNKSTDLDWFQYRYPGLLHPIIHYDSLSDNIYTSAFNKDSLLRLKKLIVALQNPSLDTTTASSYQHELRAKLYIYKLSVKREKPFAYYVKAPLKMVCVMLYGPATRNYLDRGQVIPFLGRFIVAFNYLIYFIILISGLIGSVCLIIIGIKQCSSIFIIAFIPLYIILVHPFMLRFFDNRFLMPAFPFLIISSAYILVKLSKQNIPSNR